MLLLLLGASSHLMGEVQEVGGPQEGAAGPGPPAMEEGAEHHLEAEAGAEHLGGVVVGEDHQAEDHQVKVVVVVVLQGPQEVGVVGGEPRAVVAAAGEHRAMAAAA